LDKGNLILCENCYTKLLKDDRSGWLEEWKKEEEEFKAKKNSMKYSYKEFCKVNFTKSKLKSSEITLEIEVYSDKKLTKGERESQTNSYKTKLPLMKEHISRAEKGDIVFNCEIYILPMIKEDDTEKEGDFNQKPKKNIIIIIKKIS